MVTAEEIIEMWADNEEDMAEMAAFSVTCEMLNISQEEAWDILAEGE
jgi:hypothetical protein